MKLRSWSFGGVVLFAGALLTTIGACNRETKKPPVAERERPPAKLAIAPEKKKERPKEVAIAPPQAQPPVPPKVQAEVPEPPPPKPRDDRSPRPVDLGRSSVSQAEEPDVRTPDLHGHDPLGADCAWFREFKRDISKDEV